jgi:hypothetical protein
MFEDKMSVDKVSVDKMFVDKMSVDKMSWSHFFNHVGIKLIKKNLKR